MIKIKFLNIINKTGISENFFYLLVLVGFALLSFAGVGLIDNIIIAYLSFVLLKHEEAMPALYAGFFLYVFNWLWLKLGGIFFVDFSDYGLLLIFGSVVVMMIYRLEKFFSPKRKKIFKTISTRRHGVGSERIKSIFTFNVFKKDNLFFIKIIFVFVLFIFSFFILKMSLYGIIIWCFLFAGIVFCFDSVISALMAMFSLLVALFYYNNNQEMAESWMGYCYYFLLISSVHFVFNAIKFDGRKRKLWITNRR